MNRHFTLRSWILLSLLSLAPTDCDRLWPASYDRESYALCATAKKPGVSFAEGQVRTESCSVPETEDTAGPSLPAGMCASTVSLPQESVVGGLLYPGCAVDVLVKSKVRSNTGKDAISTTVLKDVRVLAVDQQRKAPTPADSEPNEIRQKRHHLTGGNEILVTLVLGREQAEFLQTAVEHGEISLTIREPLHAQAILSEQQFSAAKSFDAVWGIINDEFWDPNFNGMDWEGARSRYKPQALVTEDHESFAVVVNRMLKELKTSHTRYFTRWEPDYYTLQAALISGSLARHGTSDTSLVEKHEPGLYSSKAKPHRVGIGVVTKLIEGRHYVSAVLSSSPAEEAGIVLGDWLVEVNGRSFHPIHSFEDNAGRELELTVQRGPLQSTGRSIKIVPVDEEERGMFEKDSYDRVTHIEHKGHRFSYIRLWWLAGWKMRQVLELGIDAGIKSEGIIIDIRDGFGGILPTEYIQPFLWDGLETITQEWIGRNHRFKSTVTFNKPVIVLINNSSRSSKELLAYYFKKTGRAVLVGERTAGCVCGGRLKRISKDSVLSYCTRMLIIDGKRLEGVGVEPDIVVPFDIRFAIGRDIQLERAKDEMVRLIERTGRDGRQ